MSRAISSGSIEVYQLTDIIQIKFTFGLIYYKISIGWEDRREVTAASRGDGSEFDTRRSAGVDSAFRPPGLWQRNNQGSALNPMGNEPTGGPLPLPTTKHLQNYSQLENIIIKTMKALNSFSRKFSLKAKADSRKAFDILHLPMDHQNNCKTKIQSRRKIKYTRCPVTIFCHLMCLEYRDNSATCVPTVPRFQESW